MSDDLMAQIMTIVVFSLGGLAALASCILASCGKSTTNTNLYVGVFVFVGLVFSFARSVAAL